MGSNTVRFHIPCYGGTRRLVPYVISIQYLFIGGSCFQKVMSV